MWGGLRAEDPEPALLTPRPRAPRFVAAGGTMREKVKVKLRVKQRTGRERDAVLPVTSPTLLFFLLVGILIAMGVVYFLVKYLSHMGPVSDSV